MLPAGGGIASRGLCCGTSSAERGRPLIGINGGEEKLPRAVADTEQRTLSVKKWSLVEAL